MITDGEIVLSDLAGKVVINKAFSQKQTEKINVDFLNSGVYLVTIQIKNQETFHFKCLVQNFR